MTIVCPKCGAELELPREMVHDVAKCGQCKTAFVASEWSGVLLADEELARYEVDRNNEKLAKKLARYLSPYEGNSYGGGHGLFSALGVSSMYFPTEVAGDSSGDFEPSDKSPCLGVYITARLEQDAGKGYPSHSAGLQRLIESAIGFRVEKTHEETCGGANGSLRCYIRYLVHADKPCERIALPDEKPRAVARERHVDEWTRMRDFEFSRAYDLINGNEVERFYSACHTDYIETLREKYKFGWIQVVYLDGDNEDLKKIPSGVKVDIDTAEGELVLPEGFVHDIEQRLARKLSLVEVCNSGEKNTYTYAILNPRSSHKPVAQNEGHRHQAQRSKSVQGHKEPSVPPDSYFSTGKKNEYRINGMIYVDVSGMSPFWTSVHSILAGLNGKGVITGWDRMNGTWDQMKRDAMCN